MVMCFVFSILIPYFQPHRSIGDANYNELSHKDVGCIDQSCHIIRWLGVKEDCWSDCGENAVLNVE